MKKRIGSKLYDTEKSELVCPVDGGQLYRKKTRDREWFAVMDDGTFRPLDVYNPDDVLLMETGHVPPDPKPESKDIMIRVDRETHAVIAAEAKRQGITISEMVRQMAEKIEN